MEERFTFRRRQFFLVNQVVSSTSYLLSCSYHSHNHSDLFENWKLWRWVIDHAFRENPWLNYFNFETWCTEGRASSGILDVWLFCKASHLIFVALASFWLEPDSSLGVERMGYYPRDSLAFDYFPSCWSSYSGSDVSVIIKTTPSFTQKGSLEEDLPQYWLQSHTEI